MVVLEVIGSEGSTDQISFEVLHPEYESFKVNFYIGKLVRSCMTIPCLDTLKLIYI